MSGFAWKLSLVVLIALLLVASTLAMRARSSHEASPAAIRIDGPPDGLIRAKRTATGAAELEMLRKAIIAFSDQEGRFPDSLHELDARGYLPHRAAASFLAQVHYDRKTGAVTQHAR